MPTDIYAARRKKLLRKLKSEKLTGMLVTNEMNVTWLTGFRGDSTWLLISAKECILISDSRYTTQIENECPGLEMHIRKNTVNISVASAEVLKKTKIHTLAYESDSLTVSTFHDLSSTLKLIELVPLPGVLVDLRAVKDVTEIQEIRDAVEQAQRGHAVIRASLLPEQTEMEIAHNLEHSMRSFGAVGVGFDPIIAVGLQAALPHARPGQLKVSDNDILLTDWGAESAGGYAQIGNQPACRERRNSAVRALEEAGLAEHLV